MGVAGQIYSQAPHPMHAAVSTVAIDRLWPGDVAVRGLNAIALRGQRLTQSPHPMQFAGSTCACPILNICFSSMVRGRSAPVGHTSVHRVQL